MRKILFTFLAVMSLMFLPTKASAQQSSEYPILGYFKLGMPYMEYFSQNEKLQYATEKDINGIPRHYVDIGGVNFDVDTFSGISSSEVFFRKSDYNLYDNKLTPIFYATNNVFVPDTLDSNEHIQHLAAYSIKSAKLVVVDDITYTNQIGNDKVLEVIIPQNHNKLVKIADSLTNYLSKKYGKPKEEYNIPFVNGKQGVIFNGIPLKATVLYTFFEPINSGRYSLIPRAIWTSGNMDIILGIESSGCLNLSFIDTQKLSHQHLDAILVKEDTKANISW